MVDCIFIGIHTCCSNLGVLLRDCGKIYEAIAAYDRCIALDCNTKNAYQNRLLALNYVDDSFDDEYVFQEHVNWGTVQTSRVSQYKTFDTEPLGNNKLRIGYVSPDFVTHSVSYFIEAPLREASNEVEIFCYNNAGRRDAKTDLLMSFGHTWRDICGKSAQEVADLVRKDRIYVLVDLTGHTAFNRLDVFALHPAPVQVTWIGYPNTTGLNTVEYRITDSIVDPEDSKQCFSETLVRVPDSCFLCYSPPPEYPDIQPLPAVNNGFITFGSLNNLAKITLEVIHLWSRVLHRVPRSRMLLKCKPFASSSVCERILSAFELYGIARKYVLAFVHLLYCPTVFFTIFVLDM